MAFGQLTVAQAKKGLRPYFSALSFLSQLSDSLDS